MVISHLILNLLKFFFYNRIFYLKKNLYNKFYLLKEYKKRISFYKIVDKILQNHN